MHKHWWMLGMTTPTGTPARCKLCGKKRKFQAKDVFGSDFRARPHLLPSRASPTELPFKGAKL